MSESGSSEFRSKHSRMFGLAELNSILNAAYMISWLLIVAHKIVLVCEPEETIHPNVIEAFRLADLLCPRYDYNIQHTTELLIVENKLKTGRFSEDYKEIYRGVARDFGDLQLKISGAWQRVYPSARLFREQGLSNGFGVYPGNGQINYVAITDWNEYLHEVKKDYIKSVKEKEMERRGCFEKKESLCGNGDFKKKMLPNGKV